jgi:epoxyqueuosine reductase
LLKEKIRELAFGAGFSHCGFSSVEPMAEAEVRFRQWLEEGHHAAMKYLERDPERRFHPAMAFPGAQSVIMFAFPYGDAETARENRSGIAMYAWGEDYHRKLPALLAPVLETLRVSDPGSTSKAFTDSGFLPERSLAVKSGLGWIGKNGTLITPESGSMVLLACIITTIGLDPDPPFNENHCGTCTLCMEACPTKAIETPGLLNAHRCIAYHTNSSKEPVIPVEVTEKMEGQIYGCDICQMVCPWNRSQDQPVARSSTFPGHWPGQPEAWQGKDESWFNETFRGSAIGETGFSRMMRNVEAVIQRPSSGDSPQANEEK